MRIQTIRLKDFKRFDDLTIDLGSIPKKIVALVGPNGCGKSSIFDAFEEKMKDLRHIADGENSSYFSKVLYNSIISATSVPYNKHNSIQIGFYNSVINRKSFYIRTAYRFTSKINVNQIAALPDVFQSKDEPASTIALDRRLENNYRRLIGQAYHEFDTEGLKTGNEVKDELLSKINNILINVLDIYVSSLGNILQNKGQLYFAKGNVKDFPYANLSAGEKEVVDIIIDLIVKVKDYDDTVFCIDEPELHLNTAVQRKLLIEIEKLIPDNCQLWVATHSIGFLRALQEELKDKAQILDFSEKDYFTGTKIIEPMRGTRSNWQRIFKTALEDLTVLLAPKKIIYCEGKLNPKNASVEQGLDAKVFNEIFSEHYQDTLFISSGGNTELDHRSEVAIAILGKVFSDIEILVLKDRDFNSGNPSDEATRQLYLQSNSLNQRVLKRWEIENYLFDKEILKKYCDVNSLSFNEDKYDGLIKDIMDHNVKDEVGFIKSCCGISFNINSEQFKLNLSKHITYETSVYSELVDCIFSRN